MREPTIERKKLEPLWRACSSSYNVECYDFQYYKISNPPDYDDDPIILEFPKENPRAVARGMD